MANENEKVTEVLAEFGKNIELMRKCKCVGVSLWNCLKYKLRVEAAHKRELASKDAEIAELRNMVEELTDALHPFREWFGNQKLIDRAKETVGMEEERGVK